MLPRRKWFGRKFVLRRPVEQFLETLERVRGAPPRVEDRVAAISPLVLVRRPAGGWSVHEHVGHLLDLEPLWSGRLDDLLRGGRSLEAADLLNRKTEPVKSDTPGFSDAEFSFRHSYRSSVTGTVYTIMCAQGGKHGRERQDAAVVDEGNSQEDREGGRSAHLQSGTDLRQNRSAPGRGGKRPPFPGGVVEGKPEGGRPERFHTPVEGAAPCSLIRMFSSGI